MIRIPEYLYLLVGSDAEASQVETRIREALEPLRIKTQVQANVVKNRNDNKRNFAYVRVSDPAAYNVLIGKTADGKMDARRFIHPLDDSEDAKKYDDYKSWMKQYENLNYEFDQGELSWADYEDNLDELIVQFSKGKEKKGLISLPYVIKPLECASTGIQSNVLMVVPDIKSGDATWLTPSIIETVISPYLSEDTKKGMQITQTNRGIVINFAKYETCGLGLSKLLHSFKVEHLTKSTRLFFNAPRIRTEN